MEAILDTRDSQWQALRAFPGSAEVKMLRDDKDGGARTMLVRVAPGGEIRPHSHLAAVQHYILEGSYETQGKVMGAGCYRFLPKEADLAPMTSRDGATILMVYDPVA
jgi:anti-sigma factor ChrR (cupin superfamily)